MSNFYNGLDFLMFVFYTHVQKNYIIKHITVFLILTISVDKKYPQKNGRPSCIVRCSFVCFFKLCNWKINTLCKTKLQSLGSLQREHTMTVRPPEAWTTLQSGLGFPKHLRTFHLNRVAQHTVIRTPVTTFTTTTTITLIADQRSTNTTTMTLPSRDDDNQRD